MILDSTVMEFFRNIKKQYGNYSRLFKLFQTKNKSYLYDVGTGKVMECTEIEYVFLNNLQVYGDIEEVIKTTKVNDDTLTILIDLIHVAQEQHLFQAPPLLSFALSKDEVLENARSHLEQVTLELTEQCNMACHYCIYHSGNIDFREFGRRHMSWQVAELAIDYTLKNSGKKVAVTFYGGEPLIEFKLLKHCVDYTLKNGADKDLTFSMTTNLTLMTAEIAEYLSTVPNFGVVCSIDGPKEIHDCRRGFKNGEGTYDKAINGLKHLINAYGEKSNSLISLSMVTPRPANDVVMKKIQNFFNSLSWVPKDITKNISYVRHSSDIEKTITEKSSMHCYDNPVGNWTIDLMLNNTSISKNTPFTIDFLHKQFSIIHDRILTETPYPDYCLNGCCSPASRRIYVTVNGDFHLCERIGKSPSVGNVYSGIDESVLIDRYIDDYGKESLSQCSKCWAIRLCSVCYVECYDSDKFNIEKKRIACRRSLDMLEHALISYHTILEHKPHLLEELNHITLV